MNRRRASTFVTASMLALGLSAGVGASAQADTIEVEACDGVTVVVDFSDIGGQVETGCAAGDPASGREALESAGFAPTNDDSGLICAIDAQPADPCGAFEGSYWAYWQVSDGAWLASQVGADDADPAPGDVEGWRYNDGSVPPPLPAASESEATSAASSSEAGSSAAETSTDSGGIGVGIWVAIGVVVVAAVVGLVLRRQRSQES